MTTILIDTQDQRSVSVCDIPEAYLHVDFPKVIVSS